MTYRLGVDVGGTFTDLLLFDDQSGASFKTKVPSTPDDPSRAVVTGTKNLCDIANVQASDIDYFLHGTTVATNAILEGKGARVGLIVTEGYRQILQIARSLVPGGLAAWIVWPKPTPMAALEDTIEVSGRMDAFGHEIRPVDRAQVRQALEKLAGQDVQAITICLMNSYVNGAHERIVAEVAREVFPSLEISMSHEILPEMFEYERALTTVANSSVQPVVGNYVKNLESELRGMGMNGQLNLLRSDGGLMSAEKSQSAPVNLLMSGPAGGVTGALWVAKTAGYENILTLDVGGTSTDVALIENSQPRLVRNTDVGHLSVRASSLDVKTVGAGGGSIAHVPELTGALRVGPESAGAVPGPVCYSKGGEQPTVTDANVVLGYLPEELLGGAFKLDREAAKAAVQTVADALGLNVYQAAAGIIDIVNENMFGALRMISVQQGYDPRDFALMGFGGAGSLHSNAVAKLMGSWPVIVPRSPGVLCAVGDATTQARAEASRSHSKRRSDTSSQEIAGVLQEMGNAVREELENDGAASGDITIKFQADVRYHGQAFEIPMDIEFDSFATGGLETLVEAFDAEHKRMFTFNMDAEHEVVNLRAIALGKALELPAIEIETGNGDPTGAVVRDHQIYMNGDMMPAKIYDRDRLKAGDIISGPAIVVEMDSTALIHAGCQALVDQFGNIIINLVDA
ncbi:MAG: hydantoinase/oxoprolinase family protein [Pseudomonadota bacterium]